MIKLLESVISCLPQNQKTLYNAQNKSAVMETIEKRIEKKSRFPISFWQDKNLIVCEKFNKFFLLQNK